MFTTKGAKEHEGNEISSLVLLRSELSCSGSVTAARQSLHELAKPRDGEPAGEGEQAHLDELAHPAEQEEAPERHLGNARGDAGDVEERVGDGGEEQDGPAAILLHPWMHARV